MYMWKDWYVFENNVKRARRKIMTCNFHLYRAAGLSQCPAAQTCRACTASSWSRFAGSDFARSCTLPLLPPGTDKNIKYCRLKRDERFWGRWTEKISVPDPKLIIMNQVPDLQIGNQEFRISIRISIRILFRIRILPWTKDGGRKLKCFVYLKWIGWKPQYHIFFK